jgi:hypothetical protein
LFSDAVVLRTPRRDAADDDAADAADDDDDDDDVDDDDGALFAVGVARSLPYARVCNVTFLFGGM